MAVFESDFQVDGGVTTRQRWGNYFTILLGVVAVFLLFNLRAAARNATSVYQNSQEGIIALYPAGWLLDERNPDDYIFRVRDMQQIGFKTAFQVSTRTISSETTVRTVFDSLTMQRSQSLTAYRTLSVEPYLGFEEREASAANYQFVATNPNPFQESVPSVVRGIDILTINRDQAIIITMLADAATFDEEFVIFERFLSQLEF